MSRALHSVLLDLQRRSPVRRRRTAGRRGLLHVLRHAVPR